MDHTSASLLERLQTGQDQAAWQRLVEVYTPLIRHWLRQREVFANDCDDILQEVLQVVVRRLPEFEHNGRVGAFRTSDPHSELSRLWDQEHDRLITRGSWN